MAEKNRQAGQSGRTKRPPGRLQCMKKTSLVVLNLTLAGSLEIEIASAQEAVPGTNDDPRARASPAESRLRLGLEQTVARFRTIATRTTTPAIAGLPGALVSSIWRPTFARSIGSDNGLAVGLSGNHWSHTQVNEYGTHEASSTDTSLRLSPRVGYGISPGFQPALVPRIGAEYTHGTTHYSNQSVGTTSKQSYTSDYLARLGADARVSTGGVAFVAPLVGFNYRVHSNYDGDTSWFSDQSISGLVARRRDRRGGAHLSAMRSGWKQMINQIDNYIRYG